MTLSRSVADVLKDHVTLEEGIDRVYLNVYQLAGFWSRTMGGSHETG
jgi:hypothetical protein